jgi:hypothetical protein
LKLLIKLEEVPGSYTITWVIQKELFDSVYSNTVLLKSLLEQEIGYADFIAGRLRKAIFVTPDKEVSAQDAIEALLVGKAVCFRLSKKMKWLSSLASNSSIACIARGSIGSRDCAPSS